MLELQYTGVIGVFFPVFVGLHLCWLFSFGFFPFYRICSALLTSFFHMYFTFCHVGFSQLCSPRRAFSEQGPLRLIRSASFFAGLLYAVVDSLVGVMNQSEFCSLALEIKNSLTTSAISHTVETEKCLQCINILYV